MANYLLFLKYAGVAQLVEQLICNQFVGGSIPLAGSNFKLFNGLLTSFILCCFGWQLGIVWVAHIHL